MDSVIHPLNNCGLVDSFNTTLFLCWMALSTNWEKKLRIGFYSLRHLTKNLFFNLKSNKNLKLFTLLFHSTTSAKLHQISINDFLVGRFNRFTGRFPWQAFSTCHVLDLCILQLAWLSLSLS